MANPDIKTEKKPKARRHQGLEPVVIAERFEITPSKPLPEYDMPPALAYACQDLASDYNCVALVCDPKMPLRLDAIDGYKQVDHSGLQKIYYFGKIDWQLESRACPLLIVENPRGDRIFKSLESNITPIDEEDALIRFMRPAVRYLRMLRDNGITHRSIRPTNLFYGDANRTKIILGEPISSLPAINQPMVCETVESSLALPAARGAGTQSEDIYALAVTYLTLLTGTLPCNNLTDQEILDSKMAIGSFQTIVGNMEFSRMAFELFHGCFEDRSSARWRIEELTEWITGKHFPLRMHPVPKKSTNPFSIGDKRFFNPRTLARGIQAQWKESKNPIVGSDIDVWVRRYISDNEVSTNLAKAKDGINPDINANHDRTLARVIIAMDPRGPIRMQSFSSMIDGFGGALAFHNGNKEIEQIVMQIIGSDLISFWLDIYPDNVSPFNKQINQLEDVRKDHRISRFGGGIESVRYFLNQGLNCLSPILENHYVFDIGSLLDSFEYISENHPERLEETLIDREIAAFISNRAGRDMRSDLQGIDSAIDPDQGRLQQVRTLASLQDMLEDRRFPNLCKVSANFLRPTLERLSGRENRKRLYNRMLSIAQLGIIKEIVYAASDEQEFENDINEFEIAKAEYRQVSSSIGKLEDLIVNRSQDAHMIGGRVASGVSGIIGCVIAVVSVFYLEIL